MSNIAVSNGASGASFQQEALDVISNNIANAQRAAFKEELLVGASNSYIHEKRVGAISSTNNTIIPAGIQIGQGIHAQAVVTKFTQGRPVQTGNPYNVMVQGKGYFQVERPNGDIAYTRDGMFEINQDLTLVTQSGFIVAPAITLPANTESVTINRNGQVYAKVAGQVEPQLVGTLEIATFANEAGLEKLDDNLMLETPASGQPVIGAPGEEDRGYVIQGSYEGANIDMVLQVTKLMQAQRAYEMNMKAVKAGNEILSSLTNI